MLKSLVSLVTGGASGLGRSTVELLLRHGGRVVICDLPSTEGRDLAKELGNRSAFTPVDVASEADVQNALKAVKDLFGRLDVVVNCAGIAPLKRTYNFEKSKPFDLKLFEKVIQVNLIGTFNVIRLSSGLIGQNAPDADGQRGVIINAASVAAYDGWSGAAGYAASKAGVVGMTLPIARDLASQGIRVVTLAPGGFRTPMMRMPDLMMKEVEKTVPFPQRLGRASEFAHLVQSVIDNPMINGETIRLDGASRQ